MALGSVESGGGLLLPFAWSDVVIHATGARQARVRWTVGGDRSASLTMTDGSGAVVAVVGELALRPVAEDVPAAAGATGGGLFGVDWVPWVAPEPGERAALPVAIGDPAGAWGFDGVRWFAGGLSQLAAVVDPVPDVVVAVVDGGTMDGSVA
ncbi:hypothetical protein, partial [Streptomyces albospinus]|uniref:hypothetical protein n=1 Tax=Streptomyces albospinus TaxID=285515 RepID=UPI001E316FC5